MIEPILRDEMRLNIVDYSQNAQLFEAIRRYYTLLKMSFDTTNIFKIYETPDSQIYRFVTPQTVPTTKQEAEMGIIDYVCPKCKHRTKLQANLKRGLPLQPGAVEFPKDNVFTCPACDARNDLRDLRTQLESESKRKIV